MQRSGLLRGGGANITRNLLDFFDITIDRDGRVLIGYVDGCEGGHCKQASPGATGNAYTVTAAIARQSSGRRMLAGKDPATTTEPPGMPSVTHRRIGRTIQLAWSEADTGNSPITGYQIWRGIASNGETLLTTVPGTQSGGTYTDLTATDPTKTYYYKVLAVNAVGTSCGNNEIAVPYVGDGCTGIVIHQNDPTHPEANAGLNTPPSLLIDYIAVGEPASSPGNFMFKMKVNSLATLPPNSRWRMTWNSFTSPGQQYYVGMRTGASGPPTFQYGYLADAGVPAVFVISEESTIAALAGSNYNPDGTITIFAPKSAFGNPQPGDLLGAVGGRTFTGDGPETQNLHRSNAFVDHTFVKAQSDNAYPAATYTVLGNSACAGGIVPVSGVSRKTHGPAGVFDINLPLSGDVGIECRTGGANGDHQVVVTFLDPGHIRQCHRFGRIGLRLSRQRQPDLRQSHRRPQRPDDHDQPPRGKRRDQHRKCRPAHGCPPRRHHRQPHGQLIRYRTGQGKFGANGERGKLPHRRHRQRRDQQLRHRKHQSPIRHLPALNQKVH